jgi:hypothetical protein
VQSWLPLDLAAANETNTEATFDPATSSELLGTNVLSIRRASVAEWDIEEVWVSYRYVQVGDDWQLIRYEITAPGSAAEEVVRLVVAHRLAEPPEGWTASMPPRTPSPSRTTVDRTRSTRRSPSPSPVG